MSLDDLARANAELATRVQSIYAERARLIVAARAEGHSWAAIGEALGMTVHGAMKASRM